MRPKVTQQWVGDPLQAVRPGFQAGFVIDAYTQDLGIQSRKRSLLRFVRRDLVTSDWCPCLRKECKDYILASEITQTNFLAEMAGQGEIRRLLSHL